jgi:UDP-glucuronate decarboxylase
VDTLVERLIRLMEHTPDDFTGPVNLGNPREFTILELAEKVVARLGSSSTIVHKPLPQDDPMQRRPDIALARTAFAWEPKVLLEDGLGPTLDYFKKVVGR